MTLQQVGLLTSHLGRHIKKKLPEESAFVLLTWHAKGVHFSSNMTERQAAHLLREFAAQLEADAVADELAVSAKETT